MEIYVKKEYVKPTTLKDVPEEIKEKLSKIFLTQKNIEKLKQWSEDPKWKGVIFDTSPQYKDFYMSARDLSYEEGKEDRHSLIETDTSNGIMNILLAHNDFAIDPEEHQDD